MAAGKNLTVKQTSNEDGAKVEYGLAGDLTNIKTIKNEGPCCFHNRRQRIQIRWRQCEHGR